MPLATSAEPPKLTSLTPDTVKTEDLTRFPSMTGWFEPRLLVKLLLRVIVSDVFGQYADRRLIEAALDPATPDEHLKRAKLAEAALDAATPDEHSERAKLSVMPDENGVVWMDYVSDLGDGFDATYAIAYLLAQTELSISKKRLRRGDLIVMGGDEVYPTAARDDYIIKFRQPYSFALPDLKGERKIPLFVLPGNHDWYDGLVNFLALFCRTKSTPIGRWRTVQRRSYFAVQLTEKWWVWGIDIALVRDMDQPQADYFVAIAEGMPEGSNIILCSAEPGWYKAEASGDSFRTLSYAAMIAENAGKATGRLKDFKIPLVLSGDSHHYARYAGPGTQYITSGGGGAFLHGTLELQDTIKADWLREKEVKLELKCCYPSKEKSSELLEGNRRFAVLNPELTTALSAVYLACAFALASTWRWDIGIALFALLVGGLFGYAAYQEGRSWKIFWLSLAHAGAHIAVIIAISAIVLWSSAQWPSLFNWHWIIWLFATGLVALTIGRWFAGQIFGWNLLLTCRHFGINHNDAFSAMKLDSHRQFLRIRIQGDTAIVYPIRLEEVPRRDQWRTNSARASDPAASVFIAEPEMAPRLIEDPVVIPAQHARSTDEVKTPRELSKAT